jgi:RNA polymerase sigma-70 factor (ECF subfamily)
MDLLSMQLTAYSHSTSQSAPTPSPLSRAQRERLGRLFKTHFSKVRALIRRRGLSTVDADDAIQQVFLVASRKAEAIEPGHERAYLFAVASRVAADARRSAVRRPDAVCLQPIEEPSSEAPLAPSLIAQRVALGHLDRLLECLAPELRSVLILHTVEDWSQPEIAQRLGIPLGTVASRLRRAKETLRSRSSDPRISEALRAALD